MAIMITQEYETSIIETRENVSVEHVTKMGENGGFYKVQLVNEFGVIVSEWKA